jgi:hypothetical protein
VSHLLLRPTEHLRQLWREPLHREPVLPDGLQRRGLLRAAVRRGQVWAERRRVRNALRLDAVSILYRESVRV